MVNQRIFLLLASEISFPQSGSNVQSNFLSFPTDNSSAFSLQARLIFADCQRAARSVACEAEHEQHKQAFTIAARILWTNITECVLKSAKQAANGQVNT